MPVPQRDWIDYVYAFAPAIAVFAAVIIGGVQLYLQRKQQQQDLFDKRYKVYAAEQQLLASVLNHTTRAKTEAAIQTFLDDTSHALFLFGPEILQTLNAVTQRAVSMSINESLIDNRKVQFGSDTDVTELILTRTGILRDILQLRTDQPALFRPYLQIHHQGSWPVRLKRRIDRWMDSEVPVKLATRNDA
jgi:Na+-transporting NADH:ubiquinone oxidoreductase subunit NqrC